MNLAGNSQDICRKNNIKPARSRGQNFLIDEKVYNRIVLEADIDKNDIVLEVGPGLGFLTEKLAEKAREVIAVELDDKLAGLLGEKFDKIENVKIFNENILNFNVGAKQLELSSNCFHGREYKVVANLPYNITSIFLRKFLEAENKPKTMTLMLQKEVAERIVAEPGKMSLLGVSVQFYAKVKIVEYVPKTAFWPVPAVESGIVKLEVGSKKVEVNEREFFRMLKIGFSARRKMLKNNLAGGYRILQSEAEKWLLEAGFSLKTRAQELSVDNWVELFKIIKKNVL